MEGDKNGSETDDNNNMEAPEEAGQQSQEQKDQAGSEGADAGMQDKYLRLYADFENYRKRVNKDKEDLVRYGNETLIYELLPILDSLELALRHTSDESRNGLVQGVEMTLKELLRTLEKFGLTRIEAGGREFDPSKHHAMTQVEREDMDENMVADELRPGYLYRDKVLRPSLVSVSARPQKNPPVPCAAASGEEDAAGEPDEHEIKINRISEEE